MSALRAGAVIDLLLGTTLTLWTLRNWAVFGAFQPIAPRYCSDIGEYAPTGFIRWFKTWLVEFADLRDIYWRVSSDPQDEGQPVELAAIPPRALDNPGKKQAVLWDIYGCAVAFGAEDDATRQGFNLLKELSVPGAADLASLRRLIGEGYTVITF